MKIDRLPPYVHDGIIQLRNAAGKTWEEIEALSALKKDAGGFIDWDNLPLDVLEQFPDLRLPKSNLHRWYKQRVELVRNETMQRSAIAREVAAAFAKAEVSGDRDASINAMRDVIFTMMSEADDAATRGFLVKALSKLADVQQKARLNDLRQQKVSVDARRVALLEKDAETKRKKAEAETDKLKKKAKKGEITGEDMDRLYERVFGPRPEKVKAAA